PGAHGTIARGTGFFLSVIECLAARGTRAAADATRKSEGWTVARKPGNAAAPRSRWSVDPSNRRRKPCAKRRLGSACPRTLARSSARPLGPRREPVRSGRTGWWKSSGPDLGRAPVGRPAGAPRLASGRQRPPRRNQRDPPQKSGASERDEQERR